MCRSLQLGCEAGGLQQPMPCGPSLLPLQPGHPQPSCVAAAPQCFCVCHPSTGCSLVHTCRQTAAMRARFPQVQGAGAKLLLRDSTCTLEVAQPQQMTSLLRALDGAHLTLDHTSLAVMGSSLPVGTAGNTWQSRQYSPGSTATGPEVSVVEALGSRLVAKASRMASNLSDPLFPTCRLTGSPTVLQGCTTQGLHFLVGCLEAEDGSIFARGSLHMRDCECELEEATQRSNKKGFMVTSGAAHLTRCSIRTDMQVRAQDAWLRFPPRDWPGTC